MAELVLTDASVTINSVDLSDHVKSVTINYSAETQEKTAMGDTTKTKLGGLLDWTLEVEFNQDYAAANVDATMFPIVGTSVPVSVKPTSGVVSATNPNYNGNAILESYSPLGGSIGEVLTTSVTLSGNGTLTRSVA